MHEIDDAQLIERHAPAAAAGTITPGDAEAYVRALERAHGADVAITWGGHFLAQQPDWHGVRTWMGELLLAQGDPAGNGHLEYARAHAAPAAPAAAPEPVAFPTPVPPPSMAMPAAPEEPAFDFGSEAAEPDPSPIASGRRAPSRQLLVLLALVVAVAALGGGYLTMRGGADADAALDAGSAVPLDAPITDGTTVGSAPVDPATGLPTGDPAVDPAADPAATPAGAAASTNPFAQAATAARAA